MNWRRATLSAPSIAFCDVCPTPPLTDFSAIQVKCHPNCRIFCSSQRVTGLHEIPAFLKLCFHKFEIIRKCHASTQEHGTFSYVMHRILFLICVIGSVGHAKRCSRSSARTLRKSM